MGEICSCCCLPVLPGPAWVLLSYVLQTSFAGPVGARNPEPILMPSPILLRECVHGQVDMHGATPLASASLAGHEKVVEMLLREEGVRANTADWAGATPLSLAARNRHGAIVRALLRREEVRTSGWRGWRPHRRSLKTKGRRTDMRGR